MTVDTAAAQHALGQHARHSGSTQTGSSKGANHGALWNALQPVWAQSIIRWHSARVEAPSVEAIALRIAARSFMLNRSPRKF